MAPPSRGPAPREGRGRAAAAGKPGRSERAPSRGAGIGRIPETDVRPIQFVSPAARKLNGVRHLMAAVLTDAVETFCKTVGSSRERSRRAHEDAAAWIGSDERSSLFSFRNLCEALDLDADAVRDGLAAWKKKHEASGVAANPGLGAVARLLASA